MCFSRNRWLNNGAWKGLRKAIPKIELVAFEPLQSPLLTTGKGGSHQVEGIGVGFERPFLNKSVLSEIRAIDQEIRVCNVLTAS